MKLLIVTQKVDRDDPVLGFFHNWIKELSTYFEIHTVICLEKGRSELPISIKVCSLGKEDGRSRLKYIRKFLGYIWRERHTYDAVFIHMNQEYVLLGAFFWKVWGKKIYLWRNHPLGTILTRVAIVLSTNVFYTSPQSFTSRFKKAYKMPVGIDTDIFSIRTPIEERGQSVLSLGRIDPIKHIDVLADGVITFAKNNSKDFTFNLVGSPGPHSQSYWHTIQSSIADLVEKQRIVVTSAITQKEAPAYYNKSKVFINLTPTGSFDKTIFEAMACGCLIISTNQALWETIGKEGKVSDLNPGEVAQKITETFLLSDAEISDRSRSNRNFIVEHHSLKKLVIDFKNHICSKDS